MDSGKLKSKKYLNLSKDSILAFRSPKRSSDRKTASTFPYYAGYSEAFAEDVLRYFSSKNTIVLDPWNGSGTTTTCAERLGISAVGLELNPVMCIVACARSANKKDIEDAKLIWADIKNAVEVKKKKRLLNDPLSPWFSDNATSIARELISLIFGDVGHSYVDNFKLIESYANNIKKSRAILMVSIFLTFKKIIKIKKHSNPTWNKIPKLTRRYSLSLESIDAEIIFQIENFKNSLNESLSLDGIESKIICANAENIPLEESSIGFILTSPPYCTRIDYAISTLFELAILGFSEKSVDILRRTLTGTTAIKNNKIIKRDYWGDECQGILDFIKNHPSHGSKNYYHKNFEEYFSSLYQAISEISRVLCQGGICAVVLQSSYYKERIVDLPKIFTEMASKNKLNLLIKEKYISNVSMARLNSSSNFYRKKEVESEELLIFQKVKSI